MITSTTIETPCVEETIDIEEEDEEDNLVSFVFIILTFTLE